MNDKTEQTVTDTLRLAARNAAMASLSAWSNLCNDAADTIDTLRAQLAEARRDSVRLKNEAAIFYEAADGLLVTNDALRAQLAEAQRGTEVNSKSIAPAPIFGDEDYVLVPRSLLGAACSAIDKRRDGVNTLAELRRYTTGDLSKAAPTAASNKGAPDA